MASTEQCMKALEGILDDIAASPAAAGLDRSVSCRLTDLGQLLAGRLGEGAVHDLHAEDYDENQPEADIRLAMTSDDLVALTEGDLQFATAWASGRIKLNASMRDILRLRTLL